MNLYDIFAGIDRHFRLREEGRQRRAAAEAGVSFIWPRDTDLTREQIEVAVGDRAAAAPSPTPGAGRTVETTALHAPRPQLWRVTSGEWREGPTPVLGAGPTMPMRSLSNENYDRVWIAQGDDVRAMGVGDTPQEAAINYAMAVSELLTGERCGDAAETWIERARPGSTPVLGGIVGTQDADDSTVVWSDGPAVYGHGETAGAAMRDYAESVIDVRDIQARYGDAFDGKAAIRQQQAHAERGDAGDGHEPPPDYEVWSR